MSKSKVTNGKGVEFIPDEVIEVNEDNSEALLSEIVNSPAKNVNIVFRQGQQKRPVRIHIGENIESGTGVEPILFLSKYKSTQVFIKDNDFIMFKNRKFFTNAPEVIHKLRNNKEFGMTIFEKDFPEEFKEWLAERNKFLQKYEHEE